MANVLLGVTGSVAAIHTRSLYEALQLAGHHVKVVATRAALYFFDPALIDPVNPKRPERNREVVVLDEDEWPGQGEGQLYQRTDQVLHIVLRRWAEVLAIAPLDANTLAKLANGLSDNCLTCVWRAWDRSRPVLLAPAMNTLMWEHPLTGRHLRELARDVGPETMPENLDSLASVDWINTHCTKLLVASPQNKRLACDDIGFGAMASQESIVAAIAGLASRVGAR
jgi:phosphopantothenoylcysteine decarboxylase